MVHYEECDLLASSPLSLGVLLFATWAIALVFGSAAFFTLRDFVGRRRWGEKTLGALQATGLLLAAGFLVWPGSQLMLQVLVLIGGTWLAKRPLRKLVAVAGLQSGVAMARRTSRGGVERLVHASRGIARVALPLRRLVVNNMKQAGVYRPGLEDEYFARATDQLGMLMHIVRAGFEASGVPGRFCFDDTLDELRAAQQAGRGILVLSPHLCGYPIFPRVLADHVPCSIYLRRSPHAGKHSLNLLVGAAGGGHLVFPPADASPAARLNVALGVLREGRALYVTPDLPRKPSEGVPVTVWGRRVYFPTGVMIMALRTGAAVVFAHWLYRDEQYHVRFAAPFWLERRGDRMSQAQHAMVAFGHAMDAHCRQHPDMWWNWPDKRWTRVLRTPPVPTN